MLKTYLSLCILLGCSYSAQSQVVYVPNPIPSGNGYPTQQSQTNQESQILTAYGINPTTQAIMKYKIKVVTIGKALKVVSYKPVSSDYWSDLALPITASRMTIYDKLADQFEYKVYLTPLLNNIYF